MDKQELFQGLRQANIRKLLKRMRKPFFCFPSEIAFGYHGDNEKIGINKPIRAQVHILKTMPATSSSTAPQSSEVIGSLLNKLLIENIGNNEKG